MLGLVVWNLISFWPKTSSEVTLPYATFLDQVCSLFEVAKAAANNPADFDLKMNMFIDPRAKQPGAQSGVRNDMSHLYEG